MQIRPSAVLLLLALLPLDFVPSPTFARPPKISGGSYDAQPESSRRPGYGWSGTLSGTLIRQSTATTSWFLYPGACTERYLGTWTPKSFPVADSLNTYSEFTSGPYTAADLSLSDKQWHVVDASTPASQRPDILHGSRSIWCGKYQPGWVLPVGYSSVSYQILYIDTGTHGSTYNLTFKMNVSAELDYDFLYLIGGGSSGAADTLGNNRAYFDDIIANDVGGPDGSSDLLVSWSGSISATTPGALSINATAGPVHIRGSGGGASDTLTTTITMPSDHRGLYLVFVSQDDFSSQDGLWPFGKGQVLDLISTSDNGSIYNEQTPAGGTDSYGGDVILGTPAAPIVSARIPVGIGGLWQVRSGASVPTADACSPQKDLATDRFFFGGDPSTLLTIPGTYNSIVACTFPIPAGTAAVIARWNEYLDLPRGSGFVQLAEYRFYKGGIWYEWRNTSPSRSVHAGENRSWVSFVDELAHASQADSIQVRYSLRCMPTFATDKVNCTSVSIGKLYDDFRLEAVTGVPLPLFGAFAGSLMQSTFVDGTMTGTNCFSPPCWPGIRGTAALPAGVGINDNINSPIGDSLTVALNTGLRQNGMGINWEKGFDQTVSGGLAIAHTNGAYNSLFDRPRMIFRLWDPATKIWSNFDSTALDADAVVISGTDTSVVNSEFRMDWPPRDKVDAGASLPGGFSIGGFQYGAPVRSLYSDLAFLPRGTRIQYYFKAVDINGGVTYQFSPDVPAYEVQDLPTLPGGGSAIAPDIIEFTVLPGVYAAGSAGSLLAGRINTPVLNLDGAYTSWSFTQDPVTQALRGMGVRADRYRFQQGYESGSNVGGHELSGYRIGNLSNYFPNLNDYAIQDSLAAWYRIVIQSSHLRTFPVVEEQDAKLVNQWWNASTGPDGGDRCIFGSGDDFFNLLLTIASPPATEQISLAGDVFGVSSLIDAWSGTSTTPYPTIDDRFAAQSAGPGLAPPNTFAYPLDGGCAGRNRFDGLTLVASSDVAGSAFYPSGTELAGVARMSEKDGVADKDRNKALGYGYSIQFIRQTGIPTTASNYVHTGVENRMRVLYKFLASCRGARTGAAADTGKCWPCPTDLDMTGEWAALSGFVTGTWGPLYPIQAKGIAAGIEEPAPGTVPFVNALSQNRPNPFNPETTIPYSTAVKGRVVIRIFDISGRVVRTLVNRVETEGIHTVRWDGKGDRGTRVASGVYFYKIEYPDGTASARKLTILR